MFPANGTGVSATVLYAKYGDEIDLSLIRFTSQTRVKCLKLSESEPQPGAAVEWVGFSRLQGFLSRANVIKHDRKNIWVDQYVRQGDSGAAIASAGKVVGVVGFGTSGDLSGGNRLTVIRQFLAEARRRRGIRVPRCHHGRDVPPPVEPPTTRPPRPTVPIPGPTGPVGPRGPKGDDGVAGDRGQRGDAGLPGTAPDLKDVLDRLEKLEGKTIKLKFYSGDTWLGDSISGTLGDDGNPFIAIDFEQIAEAVRGLAASKSNN